MKKLDGLLPQKINSWWVEPWYPRLVAMPLQKKLEAVVESKGMAHSQICMYYIWCVYIYIYTYIIHIIWISMCIYIITRICMVDLGDCWLIILRYCCQIRDVYLDTPWCHQTWTKNIYFEDFPSYNPPFTEDFRETAMLDGTFQGICDIFWYSIISH